MHVHTHTQIYMFNLSKDNESTNAKMVLDQSTAKKDTPYLRGKKIFLHIEIENSVIYL